MKRFCHQCGKKTVHDKKTDVHGNGSFTGPIERTLLFFVTFAASEAMADRYVQCEECGRISRP